jgi:hypothetical protein
MTLFRWGLLQYACDISSERVKLWNEVQRVHSSNGYTYESYAIQRALSKCTTGYLRGSIDAIESRKHLATLFMNAKTEAEIGLLFRIMPYLKTLELIELNGCGAALIAGLEFYGEELKRQISGDDLARKLAVLIDVTVYTHINCPTDWSEEGPTEWGEGSSSRYVKLDDRTATLIINHFERHDEIYDITEQRNPASHDVYEELLESPSASLANGVL